MNVTILGLTPLTSEFYTGDFEPLEEDLTCRKVADLVPGTFSKIHVVKCSNDESRDWVLKMPNQKGLVLNNREAKILKVLNAHEKEEGKEHLVRLVAFFTLGIEELGLEPEGLDSPHAPVMLFPRYQSDLHDFFNTNSTFPLETAVDAAKQLLEIAAFLERNHLIHRDIKPENIFIEQTNGALKIRLADFGTAIWENEDTEIAKKIQGTVASLSPEVLNWLLSKSRPPLPPYSFASDLWSIGIVLFDSISRSDLFIIKQSLPIEEKVKNLVKLHKKFPEDFEGRLLSIPELDQFPVLERVLQGILQMDPKERTPSNAALELLRHPA